MTPKNDTTAPDNTGFSLNGHADPYLAGEAVLDRAKSVAQRIAERVRHLTDENWTEDGTAPETSDQPPPTDDPDATDEHIPLSD